jgi:hypothetical protein
MAITQIIKSIALIVAVSFAGAWLGQYILYHNHISEAICFTEDCEGVTQTAIIGTLFVILLFNAVYFIFTSPAFSQTPGIEIGILLSCMIVNGMHFSNTNAYLALIPYNISTAFFYYQYKKRLNKPFGWFTFALQEVFLILLLLCTYLYLDELFVSKGLNRDVVMNTGSEKFIGSILSFVAWTVFIIHLLWVGKHLVNRFVVHREVAGIGNKA